MAAHWKPTEWALPQIRGVRIDEFAATKISDGETE